MSPVLHIWGLLLPYGPVILLFAIETSVDALPSKNQVLCEYCIHVNKLTHC